MRPPTLRHNSRNSALALAPRLGMRPPTPGETFIIQSMVSFPALLWVEIGLLCAFIFQAWARAELTGRRLSECGLRLHFSGLGEGRFAIALPRRSSLRLMPHGMPCFSGLGEGRFAIALSRRSSLRLMPHGMPCFSGLGEAFPYRHKSPPAHGMPCFSGLGEAFPYRHKSPPAHGMPCFSGLGEGRFAIALPRRSSLRLMPHGMPCFSGLGEGHFAIALSRRSSLRLMPHGMPCFSGLGEGKINGETAERMRSAPSLFRPGRGAFRHRVVPAVFLAAHAAWHALLFRPGRGVPIQA